MNGRIAAVAAGAGLAVGLLCRGPLPAEAAPRFRGVLQPLVGKRVLLTTRSGSQEGTLASYDAQWVVVRDTGSPVWLQIGDVVSVRAAP